MSHSIWLLSLADICRGVLAPILEIPGICVTYLYKNITAMAISIWTTPITLSRLKFSILDVWLSIFFKVLEK